MRQSWHKTLDIYNNLKELIFFDFDENNYENFHLKISDFLYKPNQLPYFITRDRYSEWLEPAEMMFDTLHPIYKQNQEKLKEQDDYLTSLKQKFHQKQMILACYPDCQYQFEPVLTDKGICFAHNPESLETSVLNSSYVDIFKKVFALDSIEEELRATPRNLTTGYKMFMVLDSHNSGILKQSSFTIMLCKCNGLLL